MPLKEMTDEDVPILNSWFRHDEANADNTWFPPDFRVDHPLYQPPRAMSLKRADRLNETVELISAHTWVIRHPHTRAPIAWASGEVWPCHDFTSDIIEGRIPDDADDLPCATFQLTVAPSHRGQGYGTAMLTAVATHHQLRGTHLWLGIDAENKASRAAAIRAGFDHEFTTALYRRESGEDIRIDLWGI